MPTKRNAPLKPRRQPDRDTDEYLKRRERNNVAVKKSREKSRVKQRETAQMVVELRAENADLERKVKLLSKELEVLKDLFLSHAAGLKECQSLEDTRDPVIVTVKSEDNETHSVGVDSPRANESAVLQDHGYC